MKMLIATIFITLLTGCSSPSGLNPGNETPGSGGSPGGPAGNPPTPPETNGAGNITSTGTCTGGHPKAFRGAEGFGACLQGGRGGAVYYVTSTATDNSPGTLQWAVNQEGPKYILFTTSGVINESIEINTGQTTIAGQTSPGGITIRGGVCEGGVYEPDATCNNIIIRFLRSRPIAGPELVEIDDAFRLSGANGALLDHVSMENATDEQLEITRSRNITVQNSIFAETIGDHYNNSGVLLNYSKSTHPLDNISLHHNLWTRIGGRYPEMSCEENPDGQGVSQCQNHITHLELNSNVIWDLRQPILYNRCTGNNTGNLCATSASSQYYYVNMTNVYGIARSSYDSGLISGFLPQNPQNHVFLSGNQLNTFPDLRDNQLACQSNAPFDVSENAPPNTIPPATLMSSRHDYPLITATSVSQLLDYMRNHAGSFPRDTMDSRLIGYLSQNINTTPSPTNAAGNGLNLGQALLVTPASFSVPNDTDLDGMPDCWEGRHGLNVNIQDHNGTQISSTPDNNVPGCIAGYTNLDCYLNYLAEVRVSHPNENYTSYVCP